ncbi:unnamed protein product [Closterium sp. Naga37s-1]|nr:unnamed protein product [Closterium sp. Naga37s-1]
MPPAFVPLPLSPCLCPPAFVPLPLSPCLCPPPLSPCPCPPALVPLPLSPSTSNLLFPSPILAELRRKTATMIGKEMQVSPEQGAFLAMLVRLMGARRCIELGVYTCCGMNLSCIEVGVSTGYSSLSVALALPADGLLVACERVSHTFAVAQRFYEKAGVKHKVDPRLGVAQDILQQLQPLPPFAPTRTCYPPSFPCLPPHVDPRLGPAQDTLQQLLEEGQAGR